jgi:hypothetical protein
MIECMCDNANVVVFAKTEGPRRSTTITTASLVTLDVDCWSIPAAVSATITDRDHFGALPRRRNPARPVPTTVIIRHEV